MDEPVGYLLEKFESNIGKKGTEVTQMVQVNDEENLKKNNKNIDTGNLKILLYMNVNNSEAKFRNIVYKVQHNLMDLVDYIFIP